MKVGEGCRSAVEAPQEEQQLRSVTEAGGFLLVGWSTQGS